MATYTVNTDQPVWFPTRDSGGNQLTGMVDYPAQYLRNALRDVAGHGSGVVNSGDLTVSALATPGSQVTVSTGRYRIEGTDNATEGIYVSGLSSVATLDVNPADSTRDRIDLLIVAIVDQDNQSGATGYTGQLRWVIGAYPGSGSPVPPAAPNSSIVLAQVYVTHGASTVISNSNISNQNQVVTRTFVPTLTGPPTTGTYVVGTVIYDSKGSQWICTTAGSPGTWVLIGGTALITQQSFTSTTGPITFSSIPQCYNHLRIVISGGNQSGTNIGDITLTANGVSSNYYNASLWGNAAGSPASAAFGTSQASAQFAQGNSTVSSNNFSGVGFIPWYTKPTYGASHGYMMHGMSAHIESASSGVGPMMRSAFINQTVAITSLAVNFGNSFSGTIALYGEM